MIQFKVYLTKTKKVINTKMIPMSHAKILLIALPVVLVMGMGSFLIIHRRHEAEKSKLPAVSTKVEKNGVRVTTAELGKDSPKSQTNQTAP